jgi:hypothetical protein
MSILKRVTGLWVILCGLVGLGLSGCVGSIGALLQDPLPTAAPGSVLFEDDFSKSPGSWGTWGQNGGVISYELGGLRMVAQKPYFDLWSVAGKNYSDVKIVVQITRLNGPTDNLFGVICRYQNRKNFYMFLASSDGYYGIAKMQDDQHRLIGMEALQYSSLLAEHPEGLLLEADCIGSSLGLSVNGTQLIRVEDGDFSEGDVGLLTGANSVPDVDILFTNFLVTQP